MSTKGLVLVTGINGFIGGRTAEAFLQAGYSVRGTVRSKASAKATVEALSQYGEKLEITEVPDITIPGAFDEAVKGVVAIVHLAQPVTFAFPHPNVLLELVRTATTRILESATNVLSVKSVVLMASISSVLQRKEGPYTYTEKDWNHEALDLVAQLGEKAPGPLVYVASKVAGEKAFWEFRDKQKPSFTMTAVHPVYVSGPPLTSPESADKIAGSLAYIWKVMSGEEIPGPLAGFGWYVDVRDVAKLVVFAVENADQADGERYISSSAYGPPQAAADILRKSYPDLPIKEGQPGEGYLPGFKTPGKLIVDGSKAEKAVGEEYIPYDQSVLDTAKMFEPLLL
ncbi:nad dependent epimerase [Colletotrichum truncatum]|uniref:Nad dependent epimerase n=1 Tax=Colletotrichum truncatum TaxID=5467 RepID=A0ACC3Z7N6_COLTU|nr:nad dependent epimerase [Colletotrichum truncatum]KAF6782996.1 nad dependent epimerase [Colletotrichum truncatum]